MKARDAILVATLVALVVGCELPEPASSSRPHLLREPVAEDVELVVEAESVELRARAERARLTADGDVLRLEGDVRARASETGTGPRAGTAPRALDLRAERLVVDSRGRVATFEESVVLRTEGITLSCARLVVRYDERGEAETLRASGGVSVTYAQGSARAAVAELQVARRRLVLSGEPRLTRAGVSLTADRVEIDLATGRATLSRPRGTIALPAASGGVVVP